MRSDLFCLFPVNPMNPWKRLVKNHDEEKKIRDMKRNFILMSWKHISPERSLRLSLRKWKTTDRCQCRDFVSMDLSSVVLKKGFPKPLYGIPYFMARLTIKTLLKISKFFQNFSKVFNKFLKLKSQSSSVFPEKAINQHRLKM